MSNYTKLTNFAVKDSLPTSDPAKIITGTAHDDEYNAISVAIATKGDLIHTTTEKTSLVDADEISIGDSGAAFAEKRITLANALFARISGALNSLKLPSSTTANRDVSPAVGYLRYNTDLSQFEGYAFNQTAVYEKSDASGVSPIVLYPHTPLTSGPATGPQLPDTPYAVGADATPVFSPDARFIAFCRLTGVGNGGLGTWDLLTLRVDGVSAPVVIASGPRFRGAPDWGRTGLVFVETDAARSRSELVLLQPDGTGRTVLRTEDAGYLMGSPRWLPGN